MASIFSPTMSDQDLLGAMVTHYEPSIQACMISANIKSTQEALAVLTKLQSIENLKEQYRTPRRDIEHQDQTRRTSRGPPSDRAVNRRPNGSVQVCHVRRDNRDRNPRGNPLRDSRTNQGRRDSFVCQRRPDDSTDPQLNASAQDFFPFGTVRRNDSQLPNVTRDGSRISALNT